MASSSPENSPSDWKRAVEELVRGREFAYQLKKSVLGCNGGNNDYQISDEDDIHERRVPFDDLVIKILKSFTNTLSIFNKSADCDELSRFPRSIHVDSPRWDIGQKSEDSGESGYSVSAIQDRRGRYKRRKPSHSWTRDTPDLEDDGHAWRKYGQKVILNAKFSRSYFRCTYKHDQRCQATKQVQQIRENPPVYRTTYYGNHTCKQQPKACHHLFMESPVEADDSAVILNFKDTSNLTSKQEYEPFFPSLINSSPSSIKQEYKDEKLQQRDNHTNTKIDATHKIDSINHHPSSSDYLLSDPDDHFSTVVDHGDVISAVNSSSCTTSSHSLDMDMIASSIDHACFANGEDDVFFPYGL